MKRAVTGCRGMMVIGAILLFTFIITFGFAASADEWKGVSVVTEDLAPLAYVDKSDNKLKGESADKVRAAIDKLGAGLTIEVMPWTRAYKMATENENVFVFNLGRTPEREKLFKWVAKTADKKVGIFALKSRKDIHIKTLEDAKKYKVVVLNQNFVHLGLLKKGFDKVPQEYFYPMANEDLIIPFFFKGRADLWIKSYLNDHDLDSKIKEAGFNPDDLVRIGDIDDMKIELYLGASLKTSDDKVEKFRAAMKAK